MIHEHLMHKMRENAFDAIIFDCDGTLAITAPLHYQALSEGFLALGAVLDRTWYMKHVGLSREPLLHAFGRERGITLDHAAIRSVHEEVFSSIAEEVRESTPWLQWLVKCTDEFQGAVASAGQRIFVEATLSACGLISLFNIIVSAEDVSEGKPSPALFLEAARRLKVNATRCLVFEDSEQGFEAAQRANMPFIDVRQFVT